MPSLSCANLLDLVAGDGFPASPGRTTPRLPRVMTLPESAFDDLPSAEVCPKRIIVSHRLPLRASPDPASPFNGVAFGYDMDTAAYQVRAGLPSPVIHVGALPDMGSPIDPSIHEELSQYLFTNFSCLPVFIPAELHSSFYHGFCKHYLWPLLHYMLPFTASSAGLPFDRSLYRSYLSANKLFADRITEVLNPDDDFVWVHDYHLLALPTFLRKRFPRVKLGFFLHSPFPSSEIFRTIPVRDDLLRALLNADLLGFHTFDYARHFLSACSRLLGLGYQSKRGYIGIEYYGRTVTVKIMPIGIDMEQLRSVVTSPETIKKVKELTEQYKDRTLLLGVDDMDLFKGIGLKFRAMEQLLEHKPELHGKVVLIQITNPARSQGKDIQEVQEEVKSISDRINARFGQPGYKPIVHIDQPVPTYEKVAYYAVAECCVVNAIRDGLNRIPYIYTVCRHESAALEATLKKKSVLVVSEFIGCSPSLSGAIRVNPWNLDSVAEAMNLATTLPDVEKQLRHEKHYKYISTHDVTYWARSFDQDLQRACKDHISRRCWGIGFGMGFRVVALGPNFRKLSVEHVAQAYKRSSKRLILLDYDGTMMPQGSINKAPSKDVISVLNELCEDPKNVVFVVSGRGKDELGPWFAPCKGLGISAEHGFFTRWSGDAEWESNNSTVDFDWKNIAEPVMNLYTETTDGSYIEHKESALVWQHQYADPDFSSWQAKELLDHLENVLANEPVVVKRGQHIVEVNPQGISKGHVVENLLSTMVATNRAPDFILCVGDDRSDEDMFEAVLSSKNKNDIPGGCSNAAEVFACTVGQKPSMARYYLDDTADVMKMLQGLVHVSVPYQNKGENRIPVSFEGSL